MKNISLFFCFVILTISLSAQHNLTVINGYGTGVYNAGDTVHIFSNAASANEYFNGWTGDIADMQYPKEWYSAMIMPARDVTVTANYSNFINPPIFGFEWIQGKDTLKPVYYGFPPSNNIIGVCYLFHGTNASASVWVNDHEKYYLVKRLLSENIAVIITECEERTRNTDYNGDAVYRWDYRPDTAVNIDVLNIKAITDTFINRGYMTASMPRLTSGASAGGAFATLISSVLGWKMAITAHNPGVNTVMPFTITPLKFNMNLFDNHPDVGMTGNTNAFNNRDSLLARGVCSKLDYLKPQPVYPERFARVQLTDTISLSLSTSIYNELLSNNALNQNGFLRYTSGALTNLVIANPSNWPVLANLSNSLKFELEMQIDGANANHVFHNYFVESDIDFMKNLCLNTAVEQTNLVDDFLVLPNPAQDYFIIDSKFIGSKYQIFSLNGSVVLQGILTEQKIECSELQNGVYFINLKQANKSFVSKLVICK
jgi:hypothetical protein